MASIIIFSSLWGILLKEWKNTSSLTKFLLGLIDLPRCPKCGLVLITEELARGKMLEVEKALEDK